MKKYSISIIISIFLLSCGKKLDLLPRQNVIENIALSSDANIKRVLGGAYDALSNQYLYGGNLFLYSELLAANAEISWEGTFNEPNEIWKKKILVNNDFVTDTWTAAYDVINICNNILGAIDIVNDDDQNRVKGEALFLRGAMYFELVKLFSLPYSAGNVQSNMGVPIVLTPTRIISESSYVPRSSVAKTYEQIVSDLTMAETLLPEDNDVYASKYVASALLSRIYLQMENFSAARDAANRTIDLATNVGKELMPTYTAIFNNESNSLEDLFAMQVSDQDGVNNMQLYWSIPKYGGRDGDVAVTEDHLDLYEVDDLRKDLFYEGAGEIRSGKWQQQYKVLPVIRLTEMYLTRAETNFRLGTSVGDSPGNDITLIRERVGLSPIAILFLDEILKERKLELAHEGHAVHDLKRLRESADDFDYDDPKMVFPIPKREVDASRNGIKQNPGYF